MKNHRRIIIAIISIVVTISLAIFLFNQDPDFIKISTSDSSIESFEEDTSDSTQYFLKNSVISLVSGWSIYAIFYLIPNEYKKVNSKKEDEY